MKSKLAMVLVFVFGLSVLGLTACKKADAPAEGDKPASGSSSAPAGGDDKAEEGEKKE